MLQGTLSQLETYLISEINLALYVISLLLFLYFILTRIPLRRREINASRTLGNHN